MYYCDKKIWNGSLDSRHEDGHIFRYGLVMDNLVDNHNYIN